jgi:hypothetical protein
LTPQRFRQQPVQVEQAQDSFPVGQERADIERTSGRQRGRGLVCSFHLAQVCHLCRKQAKVLPLPSSESLNQDDAAAQVRWTVAGAQELMQIDDGNDLAAEDEHTSEPGRAAGEVLEADAGDDLLNVPNVKGIATGTDLEHQREHDNQHL